MHTTVLEVGPRDGLQNEDRILAVDDRIAFITRCVEAGARRIEAVSFAHPKRVPQMAGAEEVMAGVPRREGVSYSGLVLNRRGLDRALAAAVDEINVVVCATDGFSVRNQGFDVATALEQWEEIAAAAHDAGVPVGLTVAASFGCPFDGETPPERVAEIVRHGHAAGAFEIALADTIGVGVPAQVRDLTRRARTAAPGTPLRFHFHNTRNTGYANALTAIAANAAEDAIAANTAESASAASTAEGASAASTAEGATAASTGKGAIQPTAEGAVVLDAAAGGFGGCPFAPAATGNIATEDLLYALHRSGITTGIDMQAMADTGTWLGTLLGKPAPALLGRAGPFG